MHCLAAHLTQGLTLPVADLRDYGIYRVPDGMLHICVRASGGRYFLHLLLMGFNMAPRYVVERDGRVAPWLGGSQEWRVEELEDTGENYRN